MKQARAFGLGVVLTTQNPADLDYKGLTNAGTWFIGRLQTERDKDRLLEGLESASAQAGAALNRKQLGEIMSDLGKRVFLLHNVHEPAPVTFQTRWAMSYLRGPLTRPQVRTLMGGRAPDVQVAVSQPASLEARGGTAASFAALPAQPAPAPEPVGHPTAPPALPAAIQQVYLPTRKGSSSAEKDIAERARERIEVQERHLLYIPALLGLGRVHFVKKTRVLNVNEVEEFTLLAQPPRGVGVVRWEQAQEPELTPRDLLDRPEPEAYFDELPETINEAKELAALKKELQDHLYRTRTLTLLYSPAAKLYSRPDEDEREFRMRLRQEARELRDAEVDKLEDRHATKLRTLEDRLRRAKTALERKAAASRARKQDALLSAGETVLSLFAGRRRSVSAAANKFSRTSTAKADVDAAEEQVAVLQEDIKELTAELKEETDAITARWEEAQRDLDTLPIQPRRNDVEVTLFALAWTPHWQIAYRDRSGITQTALLPAH